MNNPVIFAGALPPWAPPWWRGRLGGQLGCSIKSGTFVRNIGVARNYVYRGQTRAVEAPSGVGSGGVPSQPTRSGWASWAPQLGPGQSPAANAFSAYSKPQNASRKKKKIHFQLSSAARTTDPTIFLSLCNPTGGDCPDCPPPLATPLVCKNATVCFDQWDGTPSCW